MARLVPRTTLIRRAAFGEQALVPFEKWEGELKSGRARLLPSLIDLHLDGSAGASLVSHPSLVF